MVSCFLMEPFSVQSQYRHQLVASSWNRSAFSLNTGTNEFPSLVLRRLRSDSARFGDTIKGALLCPLRICLPPSVMAAILCDPSFCSTGVRNNLFEFCVHCFKCSANRWLGISWFLHASSLLTGLTGSSS